jgi:hypothetical protein
MFRFAFSAVVLAGVLATAHPVFADTFTATASDHVQVAAPAAEQAAPLAPARSSSSDAPAPASASAEGGKDIPVGFGWG